MALFGGSRAAEVQLPPNTRMTLVADVAGTNKANDAFWKEKCKVIPEKATTLFIVVVMGEVIDFFKPVEGTSFCEMLLSNNKHKWSIDGMNWLTPAPYDGYEAPPPDYTKELPDHPVASHRGGSANDWPRIE
eukprot:gene19610-biopygen6557